MTISNLSNASAEAVNRALETNRAEEGDSSTERVASSSLADKDAFLQLLVAQIKHQDPLNPTDGLEFLSQLAQFSQIEQMIGIRSDLQALGDSLAASQPNPSNAAE